MDCLNDIDGGYSASDVIFLNLWKISRFMEFLHHVDRRWMYLLNFNSLSINESCHKALSNNCNHLDWCLIECQLNTFVWLVFNNLEKWLIIFTDPYIIFS